MKSTKFLSVLLTVLFMFSLNTQYAQAKWGSKSGDLPGADEGGTTTLLVVGGVLVTGLIVYAIVKKNKQKKSAASILNPNGNSTMLRTETSASQSLSNEFQKAAEQSPVQLFTENNTFKKPQNMDMQAVSVGLRFKF